MVCTVSRMYLPQMHAFDALRFTDSYGCVFESTTFLCESKVITRRNPPRRIPAIHQTKAEAIFDVERACTRVRVRVRE